MNSNNAFSNPGVEVSFQNKCSNSQAWFIEPGASAYIDGRQWTCSTATRWVTLTLAGKCMNRSRKILREKESERDFGKARAIQCTYEMIWIYNMLHTYIYVYNQHIYIYPGSIYVVYTEMWVLCAFTLGRICLRWLLTLEVGRATGRPAINAIE